MKENMIVQVIKLAFVEVKNIGFNNGGVEKTSLFVMSGYTISSVYFALISVRLKIFITLTMKMSQTFLMLNLYTLLKLQLLTTKFSHCLQSYFLYTDQWSVLSK